MALTAVDKVKINKYLKEHAIEEISYAEMCDYLGKRGKISHLDFLEHFTDLAINEFRKEIKISINHLTKITICIRSFVEWMNEEETKISENIVDKIKNLKYFYEEYLEKTGYEMDQEYVEKHIDPLLKRINKLYPSKQQNESITKYINKIAELNVQIKGLKKELSNLTTTYDKLQETSEQKNDKLDTLNKNLMIAERNIASKEKEIDRLNEIVESLNSRISGLESSLSKVQEENMTLAPYMEQCQTLTSEIENLRKVIQDKVEEKKEATKLKQKESQIESLIYQKLLVDRVDLDGILNYVKSRGLVSNKDEIASLLKKIKNRINIDSSNFSLSPNYKITSPRISENRKFTINIPNGTQYYDIMLVSDFHIEEFDAKVLAGFDALNDYCVKNGIHLVLNLGDFFNGTPGKPLEYAYATYNYKIVEQSIEAIPKADGLYHAVLGGNHERSIVRYGFDPLGVLSQEREDFIHLGYKHSTISLNNLSNNIGCFDIHHPDNFDFPINLDSCGIDIEEVDNYLSDIYNHQGRSRDNSYIDIFGHTHKSQFNYPGSYCYIPSFLEGKSKRGACHLRIYFDEDTDIKYMVFMPLSFNTKLVKNNEIIYQKVLKK